jgi:hypothetical protein
VEDHPAGQAVNMYTYIYRHSPLFFARSLLPSDL